MKKYLVTNIGPLSSGLHILPDKKLMEGKKQVYMNELFTELGHSNGSGVAIYLDKVTASYQQLLNDKYPKAQVAVIDHYSQS